MFFKSAIIIGTRYTVPLYVFQSRCTRRYFSWSRQRLRNESQQVKVGGNGFIDLNIIRPARTHRTRENGVIVIHLAAGPLPESCCTQPTSLGASELGQQLPEATVFDVQYRLSGRDPNVEHDFRFPTPVHDVCAAFDYILKEISDQQGISNPSRDTKILLYGSHIGGALALTLALTNPERIHALALENPVVDWPSLEEIAKLNPNKRRNQHGTRHEPKDTPAEAAAALMKLRTNLFRTPSGYFDPFASPTLFLRAPGRDTPTTATASPEDMDLLYSQSSPIRYGEEDGEIGLVQSSDHSYGPYDDDWHADETAKIRDQYYRMDGALPTAKNSVDEIADSDSSNALHMQRSDPSSNETQILPRRRKVLQRWPPTQYSDDVVLPYVNVFLGAAKKADLDSGDAGPDIGVVTRLQGLELTELLQRACFWGREKSFAEERVGHTMFDHGSSEQQRRDAIVEWSKTVLSRS